MKLSVLMPVYNEKDWIEKIVEEVLSQKVTGVKEIELVIVDDGSKDGTRELVGRLATKHPEKIKAFFHDQNQGKGAAVRTAVEQMTGDICITQDADWEYDPKNYQDILEPIIEGRADCVYGSRFLGSQPKRIHLFWHYAGNRFLTFLTNILANLNLTDMETGYKAFRADLLKSIPIRSRGFSFEPEITIKVAKRKCRIYEVGISYHGRSYAEGKKITWVDGFKAILTLLRYSFWKDKVDHQPLRPTERSAKII